MAVSQSAKTVVGVFGDMDHAEAAVRDLQAQGFKNDEISIVASDEAGKLKKTAAAPGDRPDIALGSPGHEPAMDKAADVAGDAGVGAALGGLGGLLIGLAALTIPGIGPIVAAGPIATMLAGMGVGAAVGGVVGALTDVGVPKEEAHAYAEGVRRGDVLVTVTADTIARADQARAILDQSNAVDVDSRVNSWKERGWTAYDDGAAPLSADELRREREYYQATDVQRKDWDRLTEQDRVMADPALAGTAWPHREAHDMGESMDRSNVVNTETAATAQQLADDARNVQRDSGVMYGTKVQGDGRAPDPAQERAATDIDRSLDDELARRQRARIYSR